MTIGKSIKQLLEERKRVILPGFGNLEVKESGGSVPAPGKRINPPGLNIKFDKSFSKEDGVLAAAFAEAGGLDKTEAEQQVLELVDAIRFALDKGETFPLADAGIFRRDEEGKIHFQPDPNWVLDPEQYGLDSMDLLELEDMPEEEKEPSVSESEMSDPLQDKALEEKADQEPEITKENKEKPVESAAKTIEKPEKKPEPKQVVKLSAKPTAKPASRPHEPWKNGKTKKRTGLWRVIWIVTGVLIVVLVVLIAIPTEKWGLFGKKEQPEHAVQAEKLIESPVVSDQSTDPKAETSDSESVQPVVKEPKIEAEPLPVKSDHFFIVAGSFSNLANASELQDKLKGKGYPAEVMVTENRMYRVSVESYSTRGEAKASLERMKSKPGMESCWLLSNE